MTYNFDAVTNRRGTDSLKYDFARERGRSEDLLPLWVADMDFPAPPEVLADLHRVVDHGVFGYTETKPDYFAALDAWFSSRFGFPVAPHEVVKMPGVVFALALAIRAFTRVGEGVILQPPVYYPFFEVIRDNGRRLDENPLLYENGKYSIDFEGFERLAAQKDTKLFLLCSPHNPVGRVWTREELLRLHAICHKHGVLVVSDEIHCDFAWPGAVHTVFGTLDPDAVVCTAPSKTFNLPGLQTANTVIKNPELRKAFARQLDSAGYSQMNAMSVASCKSAYQNGAPWLAALLEYLVGNLAFARDYIAAHLPGVRMVEPEGTFLLWLDFSAYALPQAELDRHVTQDAGLWLDSGALFGKEGEGFERLNFACPRSTLEEAFRRLCRNRR
ncbi:MAG: pyridoxal phosphate-dependent aminotransferase [Oscillospiraceae bacterium]|jgi:cystathionine beta-lyase|nr:pyridoxal phosphate-dependent aminotransferase [Oscillospiraceae bacterium]